MTYKTLRKYLETIRIEKVPNLKKYLTQKEEFAKKNKFKIDMKKVESAYKFKKLTFDIYVVDELEVMAEIDPDFTEAGNWCRYLYIPYGDVWVAKHCYEDKNLREQCLEHEMYESNLMVKGIEYDIAHDMTNAMWITEVYKNKKPAKDAK